LKHRVVSIGLCVVLFACFLPLSLTAASAGDDAVTTVAYDNLRSLVIAGNPDYASALREIENTKRLLASATSEHQAAMDDENWAGNINQIMSLQTSMDNYEKQVTDLTTQLPGVADKQTHQARQKYINNFILLYNLGTAVSAQQSLEAQLPQAQMKVDLGLAAQATLNTLNQQIKDSKDAVKTAQKAIDDNLKDLKKFLGLYGDIKLGALPKMDLTRIAKRDYDADLALYLVAAPAVVSAQSAYDKVLETYQNNKTTANRIAVETAQLKLDDAKETARDEFPDIFSALQDQYDEYLNRDTLADKQAELAKLQKQYALGLVSKAQVTVKQKEIDETLSAKDRDGVQLFWKLLDYEFSLIAY